MDFVQQLKASVDIVRVVQDYVRLRKAGTRYTGLCPFHNEKTPSFSVNPALQFYYCHGCHAGGDVLTFLMQIEHLSFHEARNTLAERNGIPIPKRSEYADEDTKLRAALYQMHEIALEEFQSQLSSSQGAEARAYMAKRGLRRESVEHFGLGYAGKSLARTLEGKGFTRQQLEASGLVGHRDDGTYYDLFRNRLMFPIHNESGKTIAFGGRALDPNDKAKYINSPETPIYKKKTVLYNLHRAREAARQAGRLILVEGYMDVIGVYASGLKEVVATCGTALTREQVQTMKRHSSSVTLNFDPDSAGSNAAEKSIQLLLAESIRIHIVQLEGGLDPDEYCKVHGGEAYAECVTRAKTYFYWLADRARSKFDMKTAEGRVDAFQFLLPAVQGLTDKIERVAVANDVASYLNVTSGLVLENFRKLAADKRDQSVQQSPGRLSESDRILISVMLLDADARQQLIPSLKELSVIQQSPAGRIYEALFALDEAGAPIHYANLHDRLEDIERKALSATLLGGDSNDSSLTLEAALCCLDTLRSKERDGKASEIKARIRDAERAGNFQEALALMQLL
ncbi:MAG: primase [Bryobacterales bacterium]|nr:primase [Bryobacterales bacterium]